MEPVQIAPVARVELRLLAGLEPGSILELLWREAKNITVLGNVIIEKGPRQWEQ
jgi:hypothetical protein